MPSPSWRCCSASAPSAVNDRGGISLGGQYSFGTPDPLRGEAVKAFVVLRPDVMPNDDLAAELGRFVKSHLAAPAFPREVTFLDALPKTPSGKIQRFVLRQQTSAVP